MPGRIDTGTIALTTVCAVTTSARDSSHDRSAPVITVRMTSLTEPPWARRIFLKSCRSARTVANRRCPLLASFSSDRGAGFTVRHTTRRMFPAVPATLVTASRTSDRGEPHDVQHLAGPGGQVGHRVHHQIDLTRLGARDPRLVRQVARSPVDVQDGRRDVDGADPVDHRVVGLVDQGDPTAGQSLDDVDLPQGRVRSSGREISRPTSSSSSRSVPGLGNADRRTW